MNILFLSQLVPFPVDAGPKVRSYHVLQYLAASGHAVTLVAFSRRTDRPEYLEHLQALCEKVYTVPLDRSLTKDIWHLGKSFLIGKPVLITRDSMPGMYDQLSEIVRSDHFDIIHADQLWMAEYALAAKRQMNGASTQTRIVLDQHNAVYLIPERLSATTKNPLKRLVLAREARVMKRYESAILAQFDRVVWVTEEDRQLLPRESTDASSDFVIPICVDTRAKAPVAHGRGRRVTFLGGLHWPPNADGIRWFVNEVWADVAARVPDATLTIIGKNPPADLSGGEPAAANIEIAGYVEDVRPLLDETAVFIVPLHAGGGMRVKIIDAWSWGLPIVSTAIGAEGIAYRDGENLLIGNSAGEFATAVIRLLTEPELARQLADGGRRTAESDYDWRQVYPTWEQVYR